MDNADHPVWILYDRLRSARLSSKYYAERLHRCEMIDFWLNIVLAASAPTSAIAGLWIITTPNGSLVWKIFAIIAAITSIIKPFMQMTKRIKDYEALVSGYRMLDFDLMELKSQVERRNKYDSKIDSELRRIQNRERFIISRISESREDRALKKKCQEDVLRELPTSCFFIPDKP